MVTRMNSTARLLCAAASTLALAMSATALPTGAAHAPTRSQQLISRILPTTI